MNAQIWSQLNQYHSAERCWLKPPVQLAQIVWEMRRAVSAGAKQKSSNDREKRMKARAEVRDANLSSVDNRGRSPTKPAQSQKRGRSSNPKAVGKGAVNSNVNPRASSRANHGNQEMKNNKGGLGGPPPPCR